jgi:bifunctional enzyme CysN/CysC/sulfate adenylyltransferase subunit 1
LRGTVVWLTERPLDLSRAFLLKHTTRTVPARVEQVRSLLDPETLAERPAASLQLNDIGRVTVRCTRPVVCDPYRQNRNTGAFILIDALTNETAAAGTIENIGDERERPGADIVAAGSLTLAHEVEHFLAGAGRIAAVVQRPEAALACAAAGIVAIYAGEEPLREALDLRGATDWRQLLRDVLLDGTE